MLKNILCKKEGLLRVAHRGFLPENRLSGFQEAVYRGCDMFECDLRLSADQHPVVIHDKKIDRTTNGKGYVSRLNQHDLRFYGIPTLEDLLQWFQTQPDLLGAFEIKDIGRASNGVLLRKTIALLKKYDVIDRSIIISFNTSIVHSTKALCPELCTGLVYGDSKLMLRNPFNVAHEINADSLWVSHKIVHTMMPLNKHDIPICIWTVNGKKDVTCLDKNVVGIVSDDLLCVFPQQHACVRKQEQYPL